jgi:15-cis-phytoene synthase
MGPVQRALSRQELDAAGIHDPALRASYLHCKELNARHGKTYFLASLLLPPAKRPYVHALYGFARHADDIVDVVDPTAAPADVERSLREWGESFHRDLAAGTSPDPVRAAVVDTVRRWDIPTEYFDAFLHSMAMDLTITGYATYADLMEYVHGSAAVIGLQMVPVLERVDPGADAYAEDLGIGFQLANFIRDVGEDLRRGRVYLPQEDLDQFGVTREHLASGVVDARVRRLLAFEIARTREIFRAAEPGIRLLHPTSRDCIRTAFTLYGGILDAVEDADYQVLDRRVAVPNRRRAAVALPALARARRARRRPAAAVG